LHYQTQINGDDKDAKTDTGIGSQHVDDASADAIETFPCELSKVFSSGNSQKIMLAIRLSKNHMSVVRIEPVPCYCHWDHCSSYGFEFWPSLINKKSILPFP
jgi:hypothetical protein